VTTWEKLRETLAETEAQLEHSVCDSSLEEHEVLEGRVETPHYRGETRGGSVCPRLQNSNRKYVRLSAAPPLRYWPT